MARERERERERETTDVFQVLGFSVQDLGVYQGRGVEIREALRRDPPLVSHLPNPKGVSPSDSRAAKVWRALNALSLYALDALLQTLVPWGDRNRKIAKGHVRWRVLD